MSTCDDPPPNVLSLHVKRLNRPTFVRQQCEPAELYVDEIACSLTTSDAGIRADLDGDPLPKLPICRSSLHNSVESTDPTSVSMSSDCCSVKLKAGGPGELLSLAQSSGSIYLGETFCAHVNLHNESNEICYNVELKVYLNVRGPEWITLPTTGTLTNASIPALSTSSPDTLQRNVTGTVDIHPGQSLNAVIQHELKALGVHIVRCVASYSMLSKQSVAATTVQPVGIATKGPLQYAGLPGSLDPYIFQRSYNFSVSKPLDVKKTFSVAEKDKSVFMEAQVQNLTTAPIFLERVVFEPSPHLTVTDLNCLHSKNSLSTHDQMNYLRPDDIRQFLYRLTFATPASLSDSRSVTQANVTSVQEPSISAGRLDITWRSTMGERGRLQTSSLKYEVPIAGDIRATATRFPSTVPVNKPFSIEVELTNNSPQMLNLLLELPTSPVLVMDNAKHTELTADIDIVSPRSKSNQSSIIWLGLTTRQLGTLNPGNSISVQLDLMARLPGIQAISGLCLRELNTDREFQFNDLTRVLVSV